ncbi:MAG: lipopolysaccharide biosynthesis [Polaromonas sp.]|nr:lipopolysaccharide biosynthesis [Polaromonas sp.]
MEEIKNRISTTQGEVSLLDVLVTLAENIKLLVIGPLFVGLCALGIGFILPPTFQSVSILQAEQPTASVMSTAAVLDPVIVSLRLAKDDTVEEVRLKLRQQIKAVIGRNDKLLTLTVSGPTAQQSQAIANAVLQQTFKESRPKGSVRARLETQLAEARVRLKNAQDAAEGLLKRLESFSSGFNGSAELVQGYAELLSATGAAQNQISTLEAQLEGLSEAQLVQSPTLPQKSSQPNKGLISIGAALATGLALLLFIFMRQAWRNKLVNEAASAKWLRIRKSLNLA